MTTDTVLYEPSGSLASVRRSRRHRTCSEPYGAWAHDPVIRPGDVYVVLTLPPGNDLGFAGWWHAVCCADCARNTQHAAAVAAREANPR
jgi:hypothetical protein